LPFKTLNSTDISVVDSELRVHGISGSPDSSGVNSVTLAAISPRSPQNAGTFLSARHRTLGFQI
jgi:hypothetical protein